MLAWIFDEYRISRGSLLSWLHFFRKEVRTLDIKRKEDKPMVIQMKKRGLRR